MKRGKQPYKLSFAIGGLLLNESIGLAYFRRRDETWDNVTFRAIEQAVANGHKAAPLRRTLREIVNRLETLSSLELDALIRSNDQADQRALLWVATCRAYRFVAEFAMGVVRERYLSHRLDLPTKTFDLFWDEKAEWNPELNEISTWTRLKLRQALFEMMREAEIISDQNVIQTADLSSRVRALLEDGHPEDLLVFPGITVEGAEA